MSSYIELANAVMSTNCPNAYAKLQMLIKDVNEVMPILIAAGQSTNLLFVVCEMLSKIMLNREFNLIKETHSQQNQVNAKQNQTRKVKIYVRIVTEIFQIMIGKRNLSSYIIKSCINVISICMKCSFESNNNLAYLINYINIFLPEFGFNEKFINNYENITVIIIPKRNSIPHSYELVASILNSLMHYITTSSYYKTYYEYRRNIYTFRNSYLASLLNITIYYSKALLMQWKISGLLEETFSMMGQTLNLLENIMMYPFTLNLHEYESEEDINDNIVGSSNQIYLPNYFRHLFTDTAYITILVQYYLDLIKQANNFEPIRNHVNSLVKIIGRIISSSSYSFNYENQRHTLRSLAIQIIITMIESHKFMESYYINNLCDIFLKVLTSYSDGDFCGLKPKYINYLLKFSQSLVANSEIVLQDGHKNPLSRAFQLTNQCYQQSKDSIVQEEVIETCQQILQQGYKRFLNNDETQKILRKFGNNILAEIDFFEEFYQNVPKIFKYNLNKNLQILQGLNLTSISSSSCIFWLHLCAQLLPNHQANLQQTKVILKYFQWAKNGKSLASLNYINTMVKQIMIEIQQGISKTSLWKFIQQITNQSFTNFLHYVIKICIDNFSICNNNIIDFSLQIFKSIYAKLKKHQGIYFDSFYQIVKQLLINLNTTIFAQPKFFAKRVVLFNVISTIWVNNTNLHYTYEVYQLIKQSIITQNNQFQPLLNLLKYMHDATGLLQPIQNYQTFKIITELILNDLKILFKQYLPYPYKAFQQKIFLKAFCKLALTLMTDSCRRITYQNHTNIPLQIYQLFHPFLNQMLKYNYPKKVVLLWVKFINLNPVQILLPIHKEMKQKQQSNFAILLRQYFDNIHRVENLIEMYPFIQDNVQYFIDWWEQVINRQILPDCNPLDVVEARIWNTRRQKQSMARLIYQIGCYNAKYWDISCFNSQMEFVTHFVQNFN